MTKKKLKTLKIDRIPLELFVKSIGKTNMKKFIHIDFCSLNVNCVVIECESNIYF